MLWWKGFCEWRGHGTSWDHRNDVMASKTPWLRPVPSALCNMSRPRTSASTCCTTLFRSLQWDKSAARLAQAASEHDLGVDRHWFVGIASLTSFLILHLKTLPWTSLNIPSTRRMWEIGKDIKEFLWWDFCCALEWEAHHLRQIREGSMPGRTLIFGRRSPWSPCSGKRGHEHVHGPGFCEGREGKSSLTLRLRANVRC